MKITEFEIWFDKQVRRGHLKAVEELNKTPIHMLDEGNPNHPAYSMLFGYDEKEFMMKQYINKE